MPASEMTGTAAASDLQTPVTGGAETFSSAYQPPVGDQGVGSMPPDQGFMESDYGMMPTESGGNRLKMILIFTVGAIVLGLIIGLVLVLTRQPKPQPLSTQPVSVEKQPAQPRIEFNKEITVPSGYVLLETDCYKSIVLKENKISSDLTSDAPKCSSMGTYGVKGLSGIWIAASTEQIDLGSLSVESINQKSDQFMVAKSVEKTTLAGMEAVKIDGELAKVNTPTGLSLFGETFKGQKGMKISQIAVLAPPDRYKDKNNNPIKSFTITGTVDDNFSKQGFDQLISNWVWK